MRYSLLTPTGRVRHWILIDGTGAWHGPNAFTTEGWITRQTAATMLAAWRRLAIKGRYTIARKFDD